MHSLMLLRVGLVYVGLLLQQGKNSHQEAGFEQYSLHRTTPALDALIVALCNEHPSLPKHSL